MDRSLLHGDGGRSVSIFHWTLLGYYAEVMHANFKDLFYLNTDNGGASVKLSLFHALIVLCKMTVQAVSG